MANNKKALILGVLGQDGSYMAELLHKEGYTVIGIIKEDTENAIEKTKWINRLVPGITIVGTDVTDKAKVNNLIKDHMPNEIYNFVGYTNVFNPWDNLSEVFKLNCTVPQNILEAIVENDKKTKLFQASSCLIYGRTKETTQNEQTSFAPLHPYGITKLYAQNLINEFSYKYGLHCCSGIFFNHESERRGKQFFTMKIIDGIFNILNKKTDKIQVGDLNSLRDMGYAPDFMEAAFKIMQVDQPYDYVIGTGNLVSMKEFAEKAFKYVGLNFSEHVEYNKELSRPDETQVLCADNHRLRVMTGWRPKHDVDAIVKKMIDNKMANTVLINGKFVKFL